MSFLASSSSHTALLLLVCASVLLLLSLSTADAYGGSIDPLFSGQWEHKRERGWNFIHLVVFPWMHQGSFPSLLICPGCSSPALIVRPQPAAYYFRAQNNAGNQNTPTFLLLEEKSLRENELWVFVGSASWTVFKEKLGERRAPLWDAEIFALGNCGTSDSLERFPLCHWCEFQKLQSWEETTEITFFRLFQREQRIFLELYFLPVLFHFTFLLAGFTSCSSKI